MLPDGCSQSMQTLARLYKGSDLYLDQLNAGAVRGMATGIIVINEVCDATPGGFASHTSSR